MSERPDDGYRVRSRIEGRSRRGNSLFLAILVILGGGWLAVTLVNRLPATATASPSARAAAPSGIGQSPARSSLRPTPDVAPSEAFPPLISTFPGAPTVPFPVLVGTLAWVQPAMSAIVGDVQSGWTQWPFVFTDGTSLCVCLEPREQNGTTNILRLLRYDTNGELAIEGRFFGWVGETTRQPFLLDAGFAPNSSVVFIATAIRSDDSWSFQLDSVGSVVGDGRNTIELGPIPTADLPDGGLQSINVWVAPDGEHVLVAARSSTADFASGPIADLRWLVATGESPASVDRNFAAPSGDQRCVPQGWANASDFVTVCLVPGDQESAIVVRRDSVDGTTDEINLGTAPDPGVISWLLDGSNGRLFGWNPVTLEVYRIEFPTLAVVARTVDPPTDGSAPEPDGSPPPRGPDQVRWLRSGELGPSTLTGSVDGRVVYAAGWDVGTVGPGGVATAGVFVFDTDALRFVGWWPPAGTYVEVGTSPDGSYVFAVGGPDAAELDSFGNHGPQLVAHDAMTGKVVLILRRVQDRLGGVPSFLTPQPVPAVRFGLP